MAERTTRHVAVDVRELSGHPTGVGRWVAELLRHWSAGDAPPLRLSLFAPKSPSPALRALAPYADWIVVPSDQSGTWWEQVQLPPAIARAAPDVFFAPAYTAPVRLSCPSVVLIHDVSYFAHPEWFGAREGWRRRLITKRAARRAACVVTVSEFSASEITRWVGIDRAKVRVIYPGAPAADPPLVAHADRPYDSAETILYVGSLFERRHIADLIAAMPLVARRVDRARLIIVGESRAQPAIDPRALAAAHGVSDRVEWQPYVDDAALEALYQRASVFAFLSDYEGFAMTPLEAIAHGVPPVLLDTPVSREVYGDSARLVRATTTDIAQGLIDVLLHDRVRQTLVTNGRERLATFSWPRAAEAVRDALDEAAR